MSKGLEIFDRILVFLLGLGLIALGLIPVGLYYDIPVWSDITDTLDRNFIGEIPKQDWYGPVLIVTCLALAVIGFWLVLANIQNRGFNRRALAPADPRGGDTIINVSRLAAAACTHAETLEPIAHASQSVAFVGDRPTATFTVTGNPEYDFNAIFAAVEEIDADFTDAVDSMDIDTVYKVQLDRIAP